MIRSRYCLRVYSFQLVILLFTYFSLSAQTPVAKRQAVIKSARQYNGTAIENVIITDDKKGVVLKTITGQTYFLNREETLQQLGITITENDFLLPKDASAIYYDQNGVPSDNYYNYAYAHTKLGMPSLVKTARIETRTDSIHPLYIINGKEATKEEMSGLDPSTIEKVDVLKGDAAALAYGERARSGVVVITLKPLYIINGKESTKEEMTKLDSSVVESVTVLNRDSATAKYGDRGRNSIIVITLKAALKDTIRATFPGGITSWRKYIERALNYPQAAQRSRTQGVIRVLTTISETGKIISAKALNDPGNGLAEEAERVIREGPAWIPAMAEGKPISVSFIQRVTFRLS